MNKQLKACLVVVILALMAISMPCLGETNAPVIHVGVLAHRGKVKCAADWTPTIEHLQEKIPAYRFVLVPCDFRELRDQMKEKDLEFVVANPFLYVEMEMRYGLHRIATLVMNRGNMASSEFHGAVFCLAGNNGIRDLSDVRGRTVAAVDRTGFGGYVMQARELKQVGVDVARDEKAVNFLGTQDAVIDAVLKGKAEVGFARADLLEEMVREGKLHREVFRILPPPLKTKASHLHGYPVSTRAYPEWPMAVTQGVSRELAKQVAIALFSMPPDSKAAIAAGASGWVTPENYQEVHNCLRELGLPPYEGYGKVALIDAARKLWPILALLAIVSLLLLLIRRFRDQKRLVHLVEERTAELSEANRSLQKEIIDRRQAEEKNRKMAAIVEFSDDAICTNNMDGIITSWNDGAVRLYGYMGGEVLGRHVSMLVPVERTNELNGMMEKIREGKRVEHFETVRLKKDGSLVDISLTVSPIFGMNGAAVGASMIARDITEHKQRDRRRHLSAEVLRILNDQQDLDEGIKSVLATIKRETGIDAAGIRLRSGNDFPYFVQNGFSNDFLITENTLAVRERDGGLCRDENGNIRLECNCGLVISGKTDPSNPFFTPGGSFWTNDSFPLSDLPASQDPRLHPGNRCIHEGFCSVALMPIRASGQIVGLLQLNDRKKNCFTLEIIQFYEGISASIGVAMMRKQAEDALREKTEVLDRFFNVALDLLCIADTDGNFRMLNREWEKTLGFTREELMSKKFLEFIHPDDMADTLEAVAKLVSQQEVTDFVNRYRCKDGSYRWIEWRSVPVGKLIYAAARDITERRLTEIQLRENRDAAEAASRAKSVFLANMSHEIRTPLNAIIGFGELLAGLNLDEKQRSYVDPIRTSGRSLLRLLNDLLDLSKIEAGRMDLQIAAVDLRLVIEEIGVIFAPRIIQKGLKFAVEVDPELPGELMLDEIRVRQVLVNIVGNALKFTDHGSVRMTVSKRFTVEDRSRLDLEITVEDTGIGIPVADQEYIFGAFRQQSEQSTAKYGGTGLGLTISRRLAEMMNGTISIKSKVGQGSTFRLCLPAVAVAASKITHRDVIRDELLDIFAFKFSGQRVLIVDDVESNREMLRALLAQVGINVVEAHDGSAAISLASEVCPDLIIMDIRMPGMSGFQATAAIKKQPSTSSIPIIALTASTQEISSPAVVQAGFASYLVKPLATTVLLREIDRVLGGVARKTAPGIGMSPADDPVADAVGISDIPADVRAGLLKDADGMLKGIVVSRVRVLVDQLADAGVKYNAPGVVNLAQLLSKDADKLDVTRMKQVLQQICRVLAKTLGGGESWIINQTTR